MTADDFLGNEADYILLSTVRTLKPGFLNSQNRVNVMLTRCKKGMVIVSKKDFLHMPATRDTLLGKMCEYWETTFGLETTWQTSRDVMNRRAVLPN